MTSGPFDLTTDAGGQPSCRERQWPSAKGGPIATPTNGRRRQPVLSFFVTAFAWSWAWWWIAAASGLPVTEPSGSLLYLAGVFGPLVGTVWLVRRGGLRYRHELLRRVLDPRDIAARWWLALLAVAAGPAALGTLGASLAGRGGSGPAFSVGAVAALVGPALVAGLVEEPGWRGVASDAWQARTRPVWAAAGIGGLWSLWHLPLSFIEGSYYHELGAGSLRFWLTHLMLVQLGILLVWLANGSGGRILLAILAHAAFNVAVGLAPSDAAFDVLALLALTAATSTVITVTRGRLCFRADDARARPDLPNAAGRSGTLPSVRSQVR